MNQKFTKFVAILATLSGTAWSTCSAQENTFQTPIVDAAHSVESGFGSAQGSFGAVQAAQPIGDYQSNLPPVVSANSGVLNTQRLDGFAPPIVSAAQAKPESKSNMLAPIALVKNAIVQKQKPDELDGKPAGIAGTNLPAQKNIDLKNTNFKTFDLKSARLKIPTTTGNGSVAAAAPIQTAPVAPTQIAPVAELASATFDIGGDSGVAQATMAPVNSTEDKQVVPAAQWQQSPNQRMNGYSSAGVPIYAAGNRQQMTQPPIVSGSVVGPMSPSVGSQSQMNTPIDAVMPSLPSYDQMPPQMSVMGQSEMPMYQSEMPAYQSEMPSYQSDIPMSQGYVESTPVPTYFDSPPGEAPVISSSCAGCSGSGCADCGYDGGAGNVSVCQSCGPNGCFDQGSVASRWGLSGSVSNARQYFIAAAMYINRTDGDIVNSNFGGLGNFSGDLGFRFTYGTRQDVTQGREVSYFGTTDISEQITRNDGLGRLSTLFTTSSFFANNEAAPFFNAVRQDERKETSLHSIEFNRVKWGWDVVKTFVGFRYIHLDDDYQLFSQNTAGDIGSFRMDAINNLFGVHVGQELFYDVGYRFSVSGVGKAGVYANVNKFEGEATNNGVRFVRGEDDNATLSGSLELGLTGHYQLNQRARFRIGYNAIFLSEVATVSDNLPSNLTPFFGTSASDSDDVFFHGISLGLEFYR